MSIALSPFYSVPDTPAGKQDRDDPWYDLCSICEERGYRPGWARFAYEELTGEPAGDRKFEPRGYGPYDDVVQWVKKRSRRYAIAKAKEAG